MSYYITNKRSSAKARRSKEQDKVAPTHVDTRVTDPGDDWDKRTFNKGPRHNNSTATTSWPATALWTKNRPAHPHV